MQFQRVTIRQRRAHGEGMRNTMLVAVALATATATSTAAASPVTGDIEIDPTAYALSGNSIHVGLARDHLRLDLGNFGLTVPAFVTGQDAFDVSFTGYGAKLQYFASAAQHGWFAGADAAVVTADIHHRATGTAAHDRYAAVGVNAGYRIDLTAGFYATPWLGVAYNFNADDATLVGERYKASHVSVFPAVHVGYRFR
jgi:hypothetical protein